ncbi:hypothetical protein GQ600_714 [Phytophthora cactorum]|nr:hypothetical protein GQ600_714 [Phytophthora cactorum]
MSYRGRCGLLISRACLRMGGLSMLRGSCCHILAGRRARRFGRPGANDYSEKLFNRQVQKREKSPCKRQRTQPPTTPSSSGTEIPLVSPPVGRTPNALDVQFLLCPNT